MWPASRSFHWYTTQTRVRGSGPSQIPCILMVVGVFCSLPSVPLFFKSIPHRYVHDHLIWNDMEWSDIDHIFDNTTAIPHHLLNISIVFDVVCSQIHSSTFFHSRWSLMYLCGMDLYDKTPEHTTSLWCGMYYLEIHVTSFHTETHIDLLYETTWNGHTILTILRDALSSSMIWYASFALVCTLEDMGCRLYPLHARWSF